MSSYLAISGVTAALQYNLVNAFGLADPSLPGLPTVSCLAPDQVAASLGGATQPENQVNLFLHQVAHNPGWRNAALPSLGADGKTRLGNPPLALDLHYLLTVYASDYWQAEALLGCAVLALHESPVFSRADIAAAFTYWHNHAQSSAWGVTQGLIDSGLADQIEMIKITPSPLGREEMAWLWTALKADYRPTYPFQVTVVLMQPKQAVSVGPPVLFRNLAANAIQPAQILKLRPGGDLGAAPGDTVVASGEFLSGVTQVVLSSDKFGPFKPIPTKDATAVSFSFTLNQSPPLPAGVYSLVAQICDASGAVLQSTTAVPIALAPSLPAQTAGVSAAPTGGVEVSVSLINPPVSERQEVALSLSTVGTLPSPGAFFSGSAPLAAPISGSATTCVFLFPPNLPLGQTLLARLVVDGVASQVAVDWTQHPPTFTGPMVKT